jgi:hypothetical protein
MLNVEEHSKRVDEGEAKTSKSDPDQHGRNPQTTNIQ